MEPLKEPTHISSGRELKKLEIERNAKALAEIFRGLLEQNRKTPEIVAADLGVSPTTILRLTCFDMWAKNWKSGIPSVRTCVTVAEKLNHPKPWELAELVRRQRRLLGLSADGRKSRFGPRTKTKAREVVFTPIVQEHGAFSSPLSFGFALTLALAINAIILVGFIYAGVL